MGKKKVNNPKVSCARRRKEDKIEPTTNSWEIERKYAYEIKLKNHLDPHWAVCFEGWTIINVDNDEVILTCSSVDHAGLHGALDKIRDLNLAIIYVKRISFDSSGT